MGGEVRGRQGVSSSNVMKERNKDVHYSIFSNCLEFFKKKKKKLETTQQFISRELFK